MDGHLFKKYELRISTAKQEKENLLMYIQEKTGVLLEEKEINIEEKKIKIQTTSTKKFLLTTKNISKVLQEKGYFFKG